MQCDKDIENNIPPCRTCGCLGNKTCGHEPIAGHGCELDQTEQCYCCGERQHKKIIEIVLAIYR